MANKEVYVKKVFNTQIAANGIFVVDVQDEASKDNYLPLNKLRITNSSSETIHVYLDTQPISTNAPDYVLGSGLGVDEGFLEGIQYNTVYIINQSANIISANEISVRVAKVEEVRQ